MFVVTVLFGFVVKQVYDVFFGFCMVSCRVALFLMYVISFAHFVFRIQSNCVSPIPDFPIPTRVSWRSYFFSHMFLIFFFCTLHALFLIAFNCIVCVGDKSIPLGGQDNFGGRVFSFSYAEIINALCSTREMFGRLQRRCRRTFFPHVFAACCCVSML